MARCLPEGLEERLIVAGVRRRVVARILAELADHADEIRREATAAGVSSDEIETAVGARLGGTSDIVDAVASDRRALAASRSRPWLVFGFGPFAAAMLAFATLSLWSVNDADLGDRLAGPGADDAITAWPGFGAPGLVVWALIAAGYCALALYRRCPPRHPAVAIAITAAIGSLIVVTVHPAHGARPGFLFTGIATAGAAWRCIPSLALLGLYAVGRRRSGSRRLAQA